VSTRRKRPSGDPRKRDVRPEVVELRADIDVRKSDLASRPAVLYHRGSGHPFTPQEAALAVSATLAEREAAERARVALRGRLTRKQSDLERARKLIASAMDSPDDRATLPEVVKRLPEAEREVVVRIYAEYYPDVKVKDD
jgi:hypothetical protein